MTTDFESDVRIEAGCLDDEWLDQPNRYLRYAEEAADARKEVDLAKEALDVARAKADREIRTGTTEKQTESMIANKVVLHDGVRKASENLIDKRHDYEIICAAVNAFEQRKHALENLVRLQVQGYNAQPRTPTDLTPQECTAVRERQSATARRRIADRKKEVQ